MRLFQLIGNLLREKCTFIIKPTAALQLAIDLEHILAGCKKDDRASQKALYSLYFNQFMTLCLRYLPERADAEEVLNNGFLKIFSHINQFKEEGSFEGWMKKIMVNSCLAFIRTKNYIRRSKIISLQSNYTFSTSDMDISGTEKDELFEKYNKEYLLQLVMMLPETTRLVFNLYVFEDYNHQEIGEALEMAERTSQAHLAKARKILAEELDKKKLIKKIQRV